MAISDSTTRTSLFYPFTWEIVVVLVPLLASVACFCFNAAKMTALGLPWEIIELSPSVVLGFALTFILLGYPLYAAIAGLIIAIPSKWAWVGRLSGKLVLKRWVVLTLLSLIYVSTFAYAGQMVGRYARSAGFVLADEPDYLLVARYGDTLVFRVLCIPSKQDLPRLKLVPASETVELAMFKGVTQPVETPWRDCK